MLSDQEIASLVALPKLLPARRSRQLLEETRYRSKNEITPHQVEASLAVPADNGLFTILVRRNKLRAIDFAVILFYSERGRVNDYRLRQYHGGHGGHTNPIEGTPIPPRTPHIHLATYRYWERDHDQPDRFAVATDTFEVWEEALYRLLSECGFHGSVQGVQIPWPELRGEP